MSVLFDIGYHRFALPREQARRLELALTLIQREGMRADAASAADAIAVACADPSRPNIAVNDVPDGLAVPVSPGSVIDNEAERLP